MSAARAAAMTARVPRTGWGSAAEQQVARFHRERDQRRLLVMFRTLMSAGLLVVLVLGVVALRVQHVRLSYRLDGLRGIKAELEESRSRLRVELATLRSLARIEGKARTELGMVPPAPDQVRLAREFVPGGGGALSMAAPLTASVQPPSRSRHGAR
jgi:cell division protein FtsL